MGQHHVEKVTDRLEFKQAVARIALLPFHSCIPLHLEYIPSVAGSRASLQPRSAITTSMEAAFSDLLASFIASRRRAGWKLETASHLLHHHIRFTLLHPACARQAADGSTLRKATRETVTGALDDSQLGRDTHTLASPWHPQATTPTPSTLVQPIPQQQTRSSVVCGPASTSTSTGWMGISSKSRMPTY